MKNLKKFMVVLVLVISVFATIGCEEKGSAEKAGEQLDKAAEDAAKKMNNLLGK